MGGQPIKKRTCTTKCEPACASNYNNHIPHEHLIAAFAALVIALCGIIVTSPDVSAQSTSTKRQTVCLENDGGANRRVFSTTTMAQVDTRTKKIYKVLGQKADYCKNERAVVEFSCRRGKTIFAQTLSCANSEICSEGACKPRNPTPTPSTSTCQIATPTPTTTFFSSGGLCIDSDGGINSTASGTTAYYVSPTSTVSYLTRHDLCINNQTLLEMSCGTVGQYYITTTTITCPSGCMNGACIQTCQATSTPSTSPTTTPTTTPTSTPPATTSTPRTPTTSLSVVITGDAPAAGSSATQAVLVGTQIGRFKISNNSPSRISVTNVRFIDNGTHTGIATRFKLYFSNQNATDYLALTASSSAPSTSFGLIGPVIIDGGSYRYVTVSIQEPGSITTGDTFQLSVARLGDILYSAEEVDLGYDANVDGHIAGTIYNLFVSGLPSVGMLVKS